MMLKCELKMTLDEFLKFGFEDRRFYWFYLTKDRHTANCEKISILKSEEFGDEALRAAYEQGFFIELYYKNDHSDPRILYISKETGVVLEAWTISSVTDATVGALVIKD